MLAMLNCLLSVGASCARDSVLQPLTVGASCARDAELLASVGASCARDAELLAFCRSELCSRC